MSRHTKKFPEALKDIAVTEKALIQEQGGTNYNQVTLITDGTFTKPDVKKSLEAWIPGIQIEKIQIIRISKHQYSKDAFRYTYHTGSQRSALNGTKKFIVRVSNYELMANVFKQSMEQSNA